MKLEDIGFYTLSDKRAEYVAKNYPYVPLQRCELILTEKCNFRCSYCRGIKKGFGGDLPIGEAKNIIDIWAEGNLKNIRLSGGEPTMYPHLVELIRYIRTYERFERIALSTNGSADFEFYKELLCMGINDFSISLDACCSSTGDIMAGIKSQFNKIAENIRELSNLTYVTVGVVLDNRNISELQKIIDFAGLLGVSDIRIIPSAQYNQRLDIRIKTNFPILKYRLNNIENGRHVRGIQENDCNKCHLVKDDMVICGGYHFPCIIYMREHGEPIGKVTNLKNIQRERFDWFQKTDTMNDIICKNNCLDVCIDYNNKVKQCLEAQKGG